MEKKARGRGKGKMDGERAEKKGKREGKKPQFLFKTVSKMLLKKLRGTLKLTFVWHQNALLYY